ncbi:MAG: pyridoxal-phosphate dependent enzyme [Bacteroidota bacterium]
MNKVPKKEDIISAHNRIRDYIHNTPILTNSSIDSLTESTILFKCENFQKVGAFKARGAHNAALLLGEDQVKNGLATHSSGNHAQAVALAAKALRTKAYIVMPSNAPKVKVEAVKNYGAEVTFCEPNLKAREDTLDSLVQEHSAYFIHPYNDYDVIAGQATCAKELIESHTNLDYIICPVGGGGLLSGSLLSAQYFSPEMSIIAGEPAGADDAYRSIKSGKLIPSEKPNTIADGLLTSLGSKTWPIIKQYVDDIITVTDDEIIYAMRLIWERMKIIIEPSCAVPLAVILKEKERFVGKKIGVILTGGNVDLERLPF